jgi:hypothetical protein
MYASSAGGTSTVPIGSQCSFTATPGKLLACPGAFGEPVSSRIAVLTFSEALSGKPRK